MGKQATEPPDLNTIGGRLRWARELRQFPSSRSAAQAFGWNENTYKAHEQGERGKEGLKTKYVEAYTRAFKINAEWLMTGKGPAIKGDERPEDLAAEFAAFLKQRRG